MEPGPFEELIYKLGMRHEKNYLNNIGEYVDLSEGRIEERATLTKKLMANQVPIIYQGVLQERLLIKGKVVEITGIPDFLIYENGNYCIRDCKLARHIDDNRHQEIIAQLKIYGLLLERIINQRVKKIDVLMGDNSIVEIDQINSIRPEEVLAKVIKIVENEEAPYSPVGWSKCNGCGYRHICWEIAVREKDVALIYGVDQNLARFFQDKGIKTIEQLLEHYDEMTLSEVYRPWGEKLQKVGKKARKILLAAQAMKERKNLLLKKIPLPEANNYVMFDLEGIPPYLDDLEKIYLWGMQVFGEKKSSYLPALAPMEEEGDYLGWKIFLQNSKKIFQKYGNIPFIHWAPYERTKIKLYLDRYGDKEGIANRVISNLVDLCALAKEMIILAEPSYSLKVVEQIAGFKRTQEEYGGNWAIAKYIEAVETEEKGIRKSIIDKILKYNQEDLEATWKVFQWLKKQNNTALF
ncbi:MAG: hypothetical protein Kow00103_11550 [Candidatus Caldatribacteriota bacterium]